MTDGVMVGARRARGRRRKSLGMLATGAVLVSAMSVVPPAQAAPATTTLWGVVRDADTDTPLSGIEVVIEEWTRATTSTVVTDAGGEYEFPTQQGCLTVTYSDPSGVYAEESGETCLQAGYDDLVDIGLVRGGVIAGVVTEATTGAPAEDRCVTFEPADGLTDNTVVCTDAAGEYRSRGLRPGQYEVTVIDQREPGQRASGVVSVIAGAVSGLDLELPASAGSASLTVTLADAITGEPASACVSLYGDATRYACEHDGTYEFAGLAPGSYGLSTYSAGGSPVVYASTSAQLTIVPGANAHVVELQRLGAIEGTVTRPDGRPLPGVLVAGCLPLVTYCYTSAITGSDGTYRLAGLTAGQWAIRFSGSALVTEFWNNAGSAGASTPVSVALGEVIAGIDAVVESTGASVSGTVVDQITGDPIANAIVRIGDPTGRDFFATTVTAADGTYRFEDLSPRDVLVQVTAHGYVSERHDDRTDGTVDPLTITSGAAVTGVDFALTGQGVIQGTVEAGSAPVPGRDWYCVAVTPVDGTPFTRRDCSRFGGRYEVAKLPPGDYTVEFSSGSGDYVEKTAAAPVHIGAPGAVTVDATLERRPYLSGVVTESATGEPIVGAVVRLIGVDGAVHMTVWTDHTGRYVASADPGEYRIQVGATMSTVQTDVAGTFTVTAGGTEGVDVAAVSLPVITGTLTDELTGDPIAGVRVAVVSAAGYTRHEVTSGADGTYRMIVAEGTHVVGFAVETWPMGPYLQEYHPNVNSFAEAYAVTAVAGSSIVIDAALARAAVVTGRVVSAVAYDDAVVRATPLSSGSQGAAVVNADGSYTMYLRSGTYSLLAYASLADGSYFGGTWNDPGDPSITTVTVAAGDRVGADIQLIGPGYVTGVVTDETGAPVPNASVGLTGLTYRSAVTDADGTYRLAISPGSYQLGVQASQHLTANRSVVVSEGTTLVEDVTLTRGVVVRGSVTDAGTGAVIASGLVRAVDSQGGQVASVWFTGGRYELLVPAGNYRIQAQANDGEHRSTWYGGTSAETATVIAAVVGHPVTADFELEVAPRLVGTVTSAAGTPLTNVEVTAFDLDGRTAGWTYTGADGRYSLPLSAGEYRVATRHIDYAYTPVWLGGGFDQATAPTVTLDGVGTATADIAIPEFATITGRLTDVETGASIADVSVCSYNAAADVNFGCARSASDGTYRLTAPPTGLSLFVWGMDRSYGGHWYGNADSNRAVLQPKSGEELVADFVLQSYTPAPPTGLTTALDATAAPTVRLAWDDVYGESGYEVWRLATDPWTGAVTNERTIIVPANTTTFSEQLAAGTYVYVVRTFGAGGRASEWAVGEVVRVAAVAPAAPTALTADPTDAGIELAWTHAGGAGVTYEIWRLAVNPVDGASSVSASYTTSEPTRLDLPEAPGTYVHVVRAVRAGAASAWAVGPVINYPNTPPPTPTDAVAERVGDEVHLAWTDTSALESGFELWRLAVNPATGATGVDAVVDMGADVEEYLDQPGAGTFVYVVRAVNPSGASAWAVTGVVDVPVTAPTAPVAVVDGDRVTLSWTDDVVGEAGFEIWRIAVDPTTGAASIDDTVEMPAGSEEYSDRPSAGGWFTYVVRATGAGGASAWAVAAPVFVP